MAGWDMAVTLVSTCNCHVVQSEHARGTAAEIALTPSGYRCAGRRMSRQPAQHDAPQITP